MKKDARIYVAGHAGLLGSALLRRLHFHGFSKIIVRTHRELDLMNQEAVSNFFSVEKPDYVFLAAGKTGGIIANKTRRADFLHENIAIQDNVFEAAHRIAVKHLVFYGSSCMYPKLCEQPIREEYLFAGPIEETSEAYAIAKIAGIVACKSYNMQHRTDRFIALVPNSMYGPNGDFDPENSHVLSALIGKFHKAKTEGLSKVELWGSGSPRREFICSDDVAEASIFAVQNAGRLENTHYNIGIGVDRSIKELAKQIAAVAEYDGKILWDASKPDGTPRKLLDSSKFLATGWQPAMSFENELRKTYAWFVQHNSSLIE
jgi:GDP-L-fucose synthase